jgi:hypothetical protein
MAKKPLHPLRTGPLHGKEPPARLRQAAYHEAGHAVVAVALRRNVEQVHLVADDMFIGQCIHGHSKSAFTEHMASREVGIPPSPRAASIRRGGDRCIIVSIAGPVADQMYRPDFRGRHRDPARVLRSNAASYDLQQIQLVMLSVYGGFDWKVCRRLALRAWALVNRYEEAIEEVANLLLSRSWLDGKEVRKVVRRLERYWKWREEQWAARQAERAAKAK